MPRLNVKQQRHLLSALPPTRITAVRRVCKTSCMKGDGVKDTLKKARSALGPIAGEIGPVVMKEFIMPMLLKKMGVSGEGRKPRR